MIPNMRSSPSDNRIRSCPIPSCSKSTKKAGRARKSPKRQLLVPTSWPTTRAVRAMPGATIKRAGNSSTIAAKRTNGRWSMTSPRAAWKCAHSRLAARASTCRSWRPKAPGASSCGMRKRAKASSSTSRAWRNRCGVLVAADGHSVFGVVTAVDRVDVAIVDPEAPQSRSLLGIARNSKGQFVEPPGGRWREHRARENPTRRAHRTALPQVRVVRFGGGAGPHPSKREPTLGRAFNPPLSACSLLPSA